MRESHLLAMAVGLWALIAVFTPSVVASQDVEGREVPNVSAIAASLRGEWVRYRDTDEGRFTTIKRHTEDHTIVTTYDPDLKPVYSHRSEYRIDESGDALVFHYRNKVVLAGPNAGAKDNRPRAYLFRIEGDRFLELHGMLKDDSGKPSLITWERLKESPIPRERA